MPILASSSDQDVKRLLELFPIVNLRHWWPQIKGTKEELCFAVAGLHQPEQTANFVDEYFSCCKQHVYVFEHGATPPPTPPQDVGNGEKVKEVAGSHAVYIIRVQYRVVLRDPLEETTLDFLWPVRVEITPQYLILRFVTLEKNLGSYFDRPYYVGARNVDEKDIVPVVGEGITPADLHKGLKKLWGDGFIDSSRTTYKKPTSRASEAMDEELGIREHNPELYAVLQDSPLYNTLFTVPPEKNISVTTFSADPSRGYIAFPRYSENVRDTDFVIREILKHNS